LGNLIARDHMCFYELEENFELLGRMWSRYEVSRKCAPIFDWETS
jgi:hypothetical protein